MITICFTYFRSLNLKNLAASLYSVLQQDDEYVKEIVLIDNNTIDSSVEIRDVVDNLQPSIPLRFVSYKHKDLSRTHSWSANKAVRDADTEWVFFTRADYLLHFDMLHKCVDVVNTHPKDWDGFVTSNGCHLHVDVDWCEKLTEWRDSGPQTLRLLGGTDFDYTCIDTGVWLARRDAFDRVGGLDEELTAWGHAQTHFQWKLHKTGTEFIRIPEVLFYHPAHGGPRDIDLAHEQLRTRGADLKEMWARYDGPQPY